MLENGVHTPEATSRENGYLFTPGCREVGRGRKIRALSLCGIACQDAARGDKTQQAHEAAQAVHEKAHLC